MVVLDATAELSRVPGNRLCSIAGVTVLRALTELNARRNVVRTNAICLALYCSCSTRAVGQIKAIAGVDELPNLRRLFLSNNSVATMEDIQCVLQVHCAAV